MACGNPGTKSGEKASEGFAGRAAAGARAVGGAAAERGGGDVARAPVQEVAVGAAQTLA